MTRLPLLALSAALLVLAGCNREDATKASAPIATIAPPAGKQWTDVVAATPEGGYRMGNPNAPVRLVEYGSFTCPHCKAFEAQGFPALKGASYIGSGRVSYEFRSFLLHSPDAAVTLLVQCRGADTFFPMAEQVFGAQDTWLGKLVKVPEATQTAWQSMPPADQFRAMAAASGLKGFLAARGLPGAQQDKCLNDPLAPSKLVAARDHATNNLGVNGTPAFFINDQMVEDVAAWPQLEPRLKDALG